MPWCSLFNPSIQIGILGRVVTNAGFRAVTRSYQLLFAEYLYARSAAEKHVRFSIEDYENIALNNSIWGLGDWIFAIPPFRESSAAEEAEFCDYLRGLGVEASTVELGVWARRQAKSFLDNCVEDILSTRPRVVGFTTGFSQTISSLTLARLVKHADPSIGVVLGGADCDGPMGEGLIRAFPWVDAVVRGEGETVLPLLLEDLLRETSVRPQSALCFRSDGDVHVIPAEHSETVPMDAVPSPDYSEFFETLDACSFRGQIYPALELCLEASRGCWWGQKHHCTFCGLNGETIAFRRKSPEKFIAELVEQSRLHRTLGFLMTDAIIDTSFFRTVLPALEKMNADFRIFFEVKSNLKREQILQLRRAGILHIQPGIESLSTPILKGMRKGTTALQNVRALKWCRQYGINTLWNIIYGFPCEPIDEYKAMADLVPSLTHLQPPSLVPLVVDRFSPYQMNPQAFGLEVTGPPLYYRWVLPDSLEVRSEWMRIAYRFEHRHLDGREPETYVGELREKIQEWQEQFSPGRLPLRYSRGLDFITIIDERPNLRRGRYSIGGIDAEIYIACDAGNSPRQIAHQFSQRPEAPSEAYIRALLEQLKAMRLVCELDTQYLSLAIPSNDFFPSVLVNG
jgi:ribosomal peptide maturation radical SAM protein 1